MTDPRVPDDDELQLGARPVPRWVLVAAGLAVIGVVVGLLVANRSSGSRQEAQPTPPSWAQVPTERAPTHTAAGEPLPIGDLAPLDLAVAGRTTWVLQAGSISVYDDATHRAGPRRIAGIDFEPDRVAARLVLDADHARVWVLVSTAYTTWLREYDAYTLRQIRSLAWSSTAVSDAILYEGRLYVVSSRGVAVLAGDRPRVLLPRVHDGVIVADAARSRLLVLPTGGATIWTLRPGSAAHSTRLPVEVYKGTLAVTPAGRIWLAGYSSPGPILAALDPWTFRFVRRSPVTAHVGPGAILLAAGRDHVFVHTGDNSAGLWCVDARTGAPDQFWPIDPVAVAAGPHNAVTIAGPDALPLRLQGDCTSP